MTGFYVRKVLKHRKKKKNNNIQSCKASNLLKKSLIQLGKNPYLYCTIANDSKKNSFFKLPEKADDAFR